MALVTSEQITERITNASITDPASTTQSTTSQALTTPTSTLPTTSTSTLTTTAIATTTRMSTSSTTTTGPTTAPVFAFPAGGFSFRVPRTILPLTMLGSVGVSLVVPNTGYSFVLDESLGGALPSALDPLVNLLYPCLYAGSATAPSLVYDSLDGAFVFGNDVSGKYTPLAPGIAFTATFCALGSSFAIALSLAQLPGTRAAGVYQRVSTLDSSVTLSVECGSAGVVVFVRGQTLAAVSNAVRFPFATDDGHQHRLLISVSGPDVTLVIDNSAPFVQRLDASLVDCAPDCRVTLGSGSGLLLSGPFHGRIYSATLSCTSPQTNFFSRTPHALAICRLPSSPSTPTLMIASSLVNIITGDVRAALIAEAPGSGLPRQTTSVTLSLTPTLVFTNLTSTLPPTIYFDMYAGSPAGTVAGTVVARYLAGLGLPPSPAIRYTLSPESQANMSGLLRVRISTGLVYAQSVLSPGNYSLTIIATDVSVATQDSVPATAVVIVEVREQPATPPVLDLDANSAELLSYSTTFFKDDPPVMLSNGLSLSGDQRLLMTSATIELFLAQDGPAETLSLVISPSITSAVRLTVLGPSRNASGLVWTGGATGEATAIAFTPAAHTLRLEGLATVATYSEVLATASYVNTNERASGARRIVLFTITNTVNQSSSARTVVNLNSTALAPRLLSPALLASTFIDAPTHVASAASAVVPDAQFGIQQLWVALSMHAGDTVSLPDATLEGISVMLNSAPFLNTTIVTRTVANLSMVSSDAIAALANSTTLPSVSVAPALSAPIIASTVAIFSFSPPVSAPDITRLLQGGLLFFDPLVDELVLNRSLVLWALVHDGALSSEWTPVAAVNEIVFNTMPRFQLRSPMPVHENVPLSLALNATDLDTGRRGTLFFTLVSDASGLFALDGSTGLLTSAAPLARLPIDRFTVEVNVRDSGIPLLEANATLTLIVVAAGADLSLFPYAPTATVTPATQTLSVSTDLTQALALSSPLVADQDDIQLTSVSLCMAASSSTTPRFPPVLLLNVTRDESSTANWLSNVSSTADGRCLSLAAPASIRTINSILPRVMVEAPASSSVDFSLRVTDVTHTTVTNTSLLLARAPALAWSESRIYICSNGLVQLPSLSIVGSLATAAPVSAGPGGSISALNTTVQSITIFSPMLFTMFVSCASVPGWRLPPGTPRALTPQTRYTFTALSPSASVTALSACLQFNASVTSGRPAWLNASAATSRGTLSALLRIHDASTLGSSPYVQTARNVSVPRTLAPGSVVNLTSFSSNDVSILGPAITRACYRATLRSFDSRFQLQPDGHLTLTTPDLSMVSGPLQVLVQQQWSVQRALTSVTVFVE
jgi:hypothetical protein